MPEYQVSVDGPPSLRNPWTFVAASDEDAVRHALALKRPVEKLHNMSVSPARLLVRNGVVVNVPGVTE